MQVFLQIFFWWGKIRGILSINVLRLLSLNVRYAEKTPLNRRARALGCHTRMREGFPRHATIAGDRPPRYGKKTHPRIHEQKNHEIP